MRRQAGTLASFAVALCGTLPILAGSNGVVFGLTLVSIGVLSGSAFILIFDDKFFHDKSSSSVWTWLVKEASGIKVERAAVGLGLASVGISLIRPGWIWLGVFMLLVGGYYIGRQIGDGVNMMIEDRRARAK